MAEHDDGEGASICYHVLKALADLNVKEEEQEIDVCNTLGHTLIDGVNMQYKIDFLQRNVSHVKTLILQWDEVTMEAVEILRTYLSETPLNEIRLRGNLGNEKGERLLSGLHGNHSITKLILCSTGLEGTAGDVILSDLLLANSVLDTLACFEIPLGPAGARALQPGLLGNHTMEKLILQRCNLGDEGLQIIAEVVTTIKVLDLKSNGITTNGLPHVTRLLQRESPLEQLELDDNPRLFDNEANTRDFSSALRNSTVKVLSMNSCELPGHALMALVQTVSSNATLEHLYVYDRVQLQEPHLGRLLEIIPNMSNLICLYINLDFMDESVLSSLNQNTSLCSLFSGANPGASVSDDNDTVADIMERNSRLGLANELLNSDSRRRVIPLGLWANGIASLFDDNRGATAVYKILHQKLPDWMSVANNTRTAAAPPLVPVARAAIVVAPEDTDALDDTATVITNKTEMDWQEEINKRDKIIASLQKELQDSKMHLQRGVAPQEAAGAAVGAEQESTTTAAAAAATTTTTSVASPSITTAAATSTISNSISCTATKRSYMQAAGAMMADDDDDDNNVDDETSVTRADNGGEEPPRKRLAKS